MVSGSWRRRSYVTTAFNYQDRMFCVGCRQFVSGAIRAHNNDSFCCQRYGGTIAEMLRGSLHMARAFLPLVVAHVALVCGFCSALSPWSSFNWSRLMVWGAGGLTCLERVLNTRLMLKLCNPEAPGTQCGLWSQKPFRVCFLGPESLNTGDMYPLGKTGLVDWLDGR